MFLLNWIFYILLVIVLIITTLFLAIVLNLFVSALGSVIFGIFTSYSFVAFQFLFFSIQRTKDGTKIKFQKIGLKQTGYIMDPKMDFEDFKYKAFSLGGIFLSLIVSFLIYIPAFYFVQNIYIKIAFLVFFIYNMFSVLFNSKPKKDEFSHLTLVQALNDNVEIRSAYYYYLKINANLYRGYTLKEMDDEIFEQKYDFDSTNPYRDSYLMLKSNRLFSQNKDKEALDLMSKITKGKETINSLARKFYYYMKIDKEKAKEIYETKEMQDFLSLDNALSKRYLAAYSYFILNDKEKAIENIKKSKELSDKITVLGLKRMEVECIDELLEEFNL